MSIAAREALMDRPDAAADATVLLTEVERPVRLYRDEWGIPHIRAHSTRDAFFGQGYAHAMDRFWQMDASRKQMEGRWAQWVGPAGLPADRLARRLRAAAASIRDYEALGPEAKAMVDAYTAGVNACLRSRTHRAPVEYDLLGVTPEPWEPWHCVASMRQRGYLMGSVWFKLWRAAALPVVGAENVARLRYDDDGADRLCIPPGTDTNRWIASLDDLKEPIQALSLLAGRADTDGGSNNWAIAPSRTTTGRPLLAGDPHRVFELPGMYAQLQLACDDFDAIGFTIPGVPAFPHFGHNANVAWCVTHAFADIHDLYVERFDPADPSRYWHKDRWLQAETTTENIKVAGAQTAGVDITKTIHGPVIAGDPTSGSALTLKSVQFFDLDRSLDCLLPMLRADSVDSLFDAVRDWGVIDHNLVAGDTGGHIGHLVRAKVPRRPEINGWLPVPGWTGEYEWDGMIGAEQMPRADDPARGYLVTANNRVVTTVPGTGDYFCTDAHPPHRAKRIEELISQLTLASPQDMAQIHQDDLSAPARLFQAALASVTPGSAQAGAVKAALLAWDGRLSPDSAAATSYSRLRWALARIVARTTGLAGTANDELMRLPGSTSAASKLWWVLPDLLRSGDLGLTGGRTWAELLAEALDAVAAEQQNVPWLQVHTAALAHPLTRPLKTAPATFSPGGAGIGGDNDTVWATGCYDEAGLAAVYGAVARYVFDVGDWDNSTWIVVGGASGDPASPHYVDQHQAWARCELIPMRYSWDLITAAGPQLTFQPPAH
jgi:penicillin G amidase